MPPPTINHTCTQEPLISCRHNDFPYPAQQRLFRGSLCHHCQLFPATCKNPFHYSWLLAALTMWEGFSASTLLSPLLLGHVHLSTLSLFLLCSPLFLLSFQGEDWSLPSGCWEVSLDETFICTCLCGCFNSGALCKDASPSCPQTRKVPFRHISSVHSNALTYLPTALSTLVTLPSAMIWM